MIPNRRSFRQDWKQHAIYIFCYLYIYKLKKKIMLYFTEFSAILASPVIWTKMCQPYNVASQMLLFVTICSRCPLSSNLCTLTLALVQHVLPTPWLDGTRCFLANNILVTFKWSPRAAICSCSCRWRNLLLHCYANERA